MNKNWHGLIKILEITLSDKDGNVVWKKENLYNTIHFAADQLLLNMMFVGGSFDNPYIPESYYFGLDGRTTVAVTDTMDTISGLEPSGFGYLRQAVSSTGTFNVVPVGSSYYQAQSPILSFSAAGGNYDVPVSNLFLTDQSGNGGTLIATVSLNEPVTVTNGQVISLRMVLSLRDVAPA
jgi:hypothetical protein